MRFILAILPLFLLLISTTNGQQFKDDSERQTLKISYFNLKKLVSKFKAVLVKFDENYPADLTKDQMFKQLANELQFSMDVIVGHMVVPYQSEAVEQRDEQIMKEERLLANSLNITTPDLMPAVFLYVGNDFKNPIRYQQKEFDPYLIRDFIRSNVDVQFNLESCIPELDKLAKKFIKEQDPLKRKRIYEQTETKLKTLDTKTTSNHGPLYLKIMERIMERGQIFVESENQRIKNLLKEKLSDTKLQDLHKRLNVLDSFRTIKTNNNKNNEAHHDDL